MMILLIVGLLLSSGTCAGSINQLPHRCWWFASCTQDEAEKGTATT